MKYRVQNVGKIENADISIDGITVLTGPNDTGKSTIGKILYTVFSSMYHSDSQVQRAKRSSIRRNVSEFVRESMDLAPVQRQAVVELTTANLISLFQGNAESAEKVQAVFAQNASVDDLLISQDTFEDSLQALLVKCRKSWDVPDAEVRQSLFNSTFAGEFGAKSVLPQNGKENSEVSIEIRGDNISLKRGNGDFLHIEQEINLIKSISYIDDPFIVDQLDFGNSIHVSDLDHRQDLKRKLTRRASEDFSVDELLAEEKLKVVMDRFNQICGGDLIQAEGRYFQYQSPDLSKPIPVKDMSTGMKSFLILKELLLNGQLEENGIVVLDEPEVHLHPAWQIAFARIIVELQKAFHLNFLITTHSVEFLTAIEHFSQNSGMEKICHYYYLDTNPESGMSVSVETSDSLDVIYRNLSTPYLELVDEEE